MTRPRAETKFRSGKVAKVRKAWQKPRHRVGVPIAAGFIGAGCIKFPAYPPLTQALGAFLALPDRLARKSRKIEFGTSSRTRFFRRVGAKVSPSLNGAKPDSTNCVRPRALGRDDGCDVPHILLVMCAFSVSGGRDSITRNQPK